MGSRKIKVVPVSSDEEIGVETETSSKPPSPRTIAPWKLFRFATCLDVVVMLVGALFAGAQGMLMPLLAIIFGDSVEATAPGQSAVEAMADTLKWFGLICGGMFLTAGIWQGAFIFTCERQCKAMRKAYLKAVLMKDIAWFDTNNPAELPTRMAAEVQAIQEALGPKTGQLVVSSCMFVAGLAVAFTRGEEGWKMTLVICSTIPLFALSGAWMAMVLTQATGDKQAFYGKAGAVAEEVLLAMRTVASFGGEAREAQRYHKELSPAMRAGTWTGAQMGITWGLIMGCFSFMYALAFWFGAHHMSSVAGGEIIMVFFSVMIGVSSLSDLGDPMVKWGSAMPSGAAMFPTIDDPPRIEGCRGDAPPEGSSMMVCEDFRIEEVKFERVSFNYPSRPEVPILRGISLKIKRGQKLALVGESGSGKSTVVQLLERFYDPASGEILVDGKPLRNLSLTWWRKQIGYVGQEPVLFATSVRKNIIGTETGITEQRLIDVVKQAQAFDFLNALPNQLDTYVGVGGGQMSGGQKQRIAIARALIRSPQILLLDEATSALDNESEKQVQATIDKLQANEASSLTTISVAHRLSTIRNSDIIFFLKAGIVQEQGSHKQLMELDGEYFKLVKSQESIASADESTASVDKSSKGLVSSLMAQADMLMSSVSDPDPSPTAVAASAGRARGGNVKPGALDASAEQSGAETHEPAAEPEKPKTEKELEEERMKKLEEEKYQLPLCRIFGLMKCGCALIPVALIGCLANGGVMPVQGYVMAKATEVFYLFFGDELKEEINYWSLWFVFCGVAAFVGSFMKWAIFTYIQESMALRLRHMAFSSLVRQDIGFYDDPANTPAGLTTTLERQAKQVCAVTGITLGNVTECFCSIITGLTLGFLGSWQLTLVCLGLMPVVGGALVLVMVAQLGPSGGGEAYSQAGAIASEAILNIRTVRALLAEQQSVEAFAEEVDKVARKEGGLCAALRKGLSYGFGNAVTFIIYIAGFWYGAWLVDEGVIIQSDMFQSIYCVMFGLMGSAMAMAFAADLGKAKLAAHDIFQLIDRPSKVDAVNPSGTKMSLGDGTIRFEEVVFHYPHRPELPVLRGLKFDVAPGQTVALVGPSGSGKSTVIQMLQRFYDPTAGRILIGGEDLRDFNIAWWRTKVALVGQEPVLFDMSLEDNVKYGKPDGEPDATREQLEAVAKKANMDYVINGQVRWEDSVGLKGGRLSGGQKQRCAIARAMIREPAILLLDEATSALDSVSEREVQKALDAARHGRTTFTIAHRLSTIQDSDKIIVIVDGILSEQGTHQELMQQGGVYFNLAKKGSM